MSTPTTTRHWAQLARNLLGARLDPYPEADAQLEQFVSSRAANREADLTRVLRRRIRRQIDLIEPAIRDVRGFRVQPRDGSAIPTT